jgi:transposase
MVGKARATRVTGEARADLTKDVVARYQAGESIRELAASLDRSYGFVHRLLTEAGIELRGRGGATRKRTPRLAAG